MRFRFLGVACAALLGITCARKPAEPSAEKLAIVRLENLGADPSTDWMGRAFAEILAGELCDAPNWNVISASRLRAYTAAFGSQPSPVPGISSERPLALAAGATRIAYGDYAAHPGHIEVHLAIEDPTAGKIVRMLSASGSDVFGAATALAMQLAPSIRPYVTRRTEALRAYATALESTVPQAIPALEQAISADPNFGPAYELLASLKVQRQDLTGAEAALQTAITHKDAMDAASRARIEAEWANLHGDLETRKKALAALTASTPRDAFAWHSLADTLMVAHDYVKSAAAYRKAVDLEPGDAAAWNQLGYTLAYSGDLAAGMNALRRYQSLRPADPNAIDSMGDLNLLSGRLKEAEEYYLEAEKKGSALFNHGDLFKATLARLMAGDISGADALAQQYANIRASAHDPQIVLFRAEWLWLTGRRRQACREMEKLVRTVAPPLAARGSNELAIWYLMLGDRSAAQRAIQTQPAGAVAIARFLLQPPAPASEWMHRGAQLFPNPSAAALRDVTVSTALLLAKDFASASTILRQLYESPAASSDPGVPIELAWTLVKTGRAASASPLLRWNPIPPVSGPSPLVSLYFPRFYYLRAVLAGQTDQARKDYELFLKLSGSNPLVWGEEQSAQAALRGAR